MRSVREQSGKSQIELALILSTTPLTLIRYEQGKRAPDAEFIFKFAAHFKVNPGWIISGLGYQTASGEVPPPEKKEITEIIQAVKKDEDTLKAVLAVVRLRNKT